MTTRFIRYEVTVEVNDEPTECHDPDFFDQTDDVQDETGEVVARFLSPETMAAIVMRERLLDDAQYGFFYSVDYEGAE